MALTDAQLAKPPTPRLPPRLARGSARAPTGASSGCTGDVDGACGGQHLLVQDALVCGVLVDQVHAVWPFGHDVCGRQLADHAQDRDFAGGRLGRRAEPAPADAA